MYPLSYVNCYNIMSVLDLKLSTFVLSIVNLLNLLRLLIRIVVNVHVYLLVISVMSHCSITNTIVVLYSSYKTVSFCLIFLADRTNGRAYATVLRLSVVCL